MSKVLLTSNKRRGFTIVELIIVIAVIGVLAAILIPTFSNIIRKANMASDVSLCKNINTANLAGGENDAEYGSTPAGIDEVLFNISENGFDMSTLTPKTEGTAFYWIRSVNRIVYIDKTEAVDQDSNVYDSAWEIVWPEELSNLAGADKDNLFNINTGSGTVPDFFALDHRIVADVQWIEDNLAEMQSATAEDPAELTVRTSDQLAALSLMIATPEGNVTPSMRSGEFVVPHFNFENCIITLTSDMYLGNNAWSPIGAPVRKGDIDLNGTGEIVTFDESGSKEYRFAGTFDGAGHTISGLSMSKDYEPDSVYENRFGYSAYTFGLFGSTFDATIKNLNMTNVHIDNRGMVDSEGNEICGDSVAAIVGLSSGALTIENCTVSGEIYSWDCAGGIVARHYASSPLTIKNCTNNANVTAYGVDDDNLGKKAGGILGYAGKDFRDVVFENVTNNGNIVGGTAGGIASYMSSSHAANSGTIDFKNVTNNGRISNHYNNEYFSAGGAGGIFGNSFNANSKTDFSVWENVINNGEVSSKNGCATFGIMGALKTPLLLKGRIENNGNLSNEGSIFGVYGILGNIDTQVTVDTSAVIKQRGDIVSSCISASPTCGVFGTIGKNSTIIVNGKIEQSGDVHNTLGIAYGVFGNVTNATVTFNSGSTVKMVGDVRGVTQASGVFGIVSSPTVTATHSVISVERGATVEVSGNIYCEGSNVEGSINNCKAHATGFMTCITGVASQIKTTTPYTFNDVKSTLTVDGTIRVTSPSITAVTDSAESTSTSITYSTISSGLVGYSFYSEMNFNAGSSVIVSGCNISATASDAAYKGRVVAAGILGHIYGSRLGDAASAPINYTIFKAVVTGTATVRDCTISIEYTTPTATNKGAAVGIGNPGAAAYLDIAGFTVTGDGNNIVTP